MLRQFAAVTVGKSEIDAWSSVWRTDFLPFRLSQMPHPYWCDGFHHGDPVPQDFLPPRSRLIFDRSAVSRCGIQGCSRPRTVSVNTTAWTTALPLTMAN